MSVGMIFYFCRGLHLTPCRRRLSHK